MVFRAETGLIDIALRGLTWGGETSHGALHRSTMSQPCTQKAPPFSNGRWGFFVTIQCASGGSLFEMSPENFPVAVSNSLSPAGAAGN